MRTRNPNLRFIASKNIFKMTSLLGIRDKFGIKHLTKIRVSFSDLRDHRFNGNFNFDGPLCSCGFEDETSVHYFQRCSLYTAQRTVLLSNNNV